MTRKIPRAMARLAAISSILLVAATGVVSVVAQDMEPSPQDTGEQPTDPPDDETTVDASVPDPELPAEQAAWEIFADSDNFSADEKKFDVLVCPPGLYADSDCNDRMAGVEPYEPAYKLFSDSADKERFVYIPAGQTIDTTDPNYWSFPPKTRLYKTFKKDGKRVETRKIEKGSDGVWTFETYAWFPDQHHVRRVVEAKEDWLESDHNIPNSNPASGGDCATCHKTYMGGNDPILGFSAIQLHPSRAKGQTLTVLNDNHVLSPAVDLETALIPGSAAAQDALGYLHANCGNCHRDQRNSGLDLWVKTSTATVKDTSFATNAVCQKARRTDFGFTYRVGVGAEGAKNSENSLIIHRMKSRQIGVQMPPLATLVADPDRPRLVDAWIDSLPNADLPVTDFPGGTTCPK
jgi:cytochrome c556